MRCSYTAAALALFVVTAAARAGAVDPCSLLAPEEIATALGGEPGLGTATVLDANTAVCRWIGDATSQADSLYLIVALGTARNLADLAMSLEQRFGDLAELRPVEGLGDFSVWVSLFGEPAALQVYRGRRLVQIGSGPSRPIDRDVAESLAVRVLARLGEEV